MRTAIVCSMLLVGAAAARAELRPDQVGVLAMATSRESRYVAQYYVKSREIPPSNVFLLSGKPGRGTSRASWEQEYRPQIRQWLREEGRQYKIRCLVTCWDVPLKIGARSADDPVVAARNAFLEQDRLQRVAAFRQVLSTIDAIAAGETLPSRVGPEPDAKVKELAAQFDEVMGAAGKRVQAIESAADRRRPQQTLERAVLVSGGLNALVSIAARQQDSDALPPESAARLEVAKARLQGIQEGAQTLSALPDTAARDAQIIKLLQQIGGLIGVIRWIDEQQGLLKKNETHSCFDSELSLVLWHEYPLFLFTPNHLHYQYDGLRDKQPTMMVARLAAPSVELVTRMVDTAMAVESQGLSGKVYLDSRGTPYDPKVHQPMSYGWFDQSLRDLAGRLESHTELEVVLDRQAKVFPPGSCPDAALYCGWYAMANYVDAFDWRPGAVGYHMASLEATTLRVPGNKAWCNAMLEDGITATLGPTAEPYLSAFPLPDDFFSLLLTGKYTLVETYYRTKPFNSWQMVLVGDPLYSPFKNRPLLKESDLPDRMQPKTLRGKAAETGTGVVVSPQTSGD